jgi:hypothetical protein
MLLYDISRPLGGDGLESVTESKDEIVTESVESVTESKAQPIEDIRRIVERVLAKSDIELALEVLSAELVDQLTGR